MDFSSSPYAVEIEENNSDPPPYVVTGHRAASIFSALSTLFQSNTFSDMKIVCREREFNAHRAVVCTQSPFFKAALEAKPEDGASGVITLTDVEPFILKHFLQFLYTGNYDQGSTSGNRLPSSAATMTTRAVSADLGTPLGTIDIYRQGTLKIEVDELENSLDIKPEEVCAMDDSDPSDGLIPDTEDKETIARYRLEMNRLNKFELSKSIKLYDLAKRFEVPSLQLLARTRFYRAAETCWEALDGFSDVVDEIYSSNECDQAMRDVVCNLVGASIHNDDIKKKMEPVMKKYGEFAVGVMNAGLRINRCY